MVFLCGGLRHDHNENNEKYDENEKYLDHEPPVRRDRLKVLEQLGMRLAYVQIDVFDVRVDTLYGFVLLFDHSGQLLKHAA